MDATVDRIHDALRTVLDPEIGRPITDLGMVRSVSVQGGIADVTVLLTIAGCPLRERITDDVRVAVRAVPGVTDVRLTMDVMTDAERSALRSRLQPGTAQRTAASQIGPATRVYAVASGKGGVGKSTVTVNLAAALASGGMRVGIIDADIYGFSIPRMMGVDSRPTQIDGMLIPPTAHGVKVISAGMFVAGNAAIVWRGPMLHRALQQFVSDVYWDDLDVLLLDLPPGTGDMALSTAQLIPSAELLVVTTPQLAAAEVAERAGSMAGQTHQRVAGVIENMTAMTLPDGTRINVFGTGGGAAVAHSLGRLTGSPVPFLGDVPLSPELCQAGDAGVPIVLSAPESVAGQAFLLLARKLEAKARSLAGRSLTVLPVAG
jgi:ATP-binding protein involved in chromosome partitioning